MPNDEPHMTKLQTKVQALGYSRRVPYYIEFTSKPKIRNHLLDMASIVNTLTYIRTPSCIYALFINTASLIRRYCTFYLHAHSVQPAVHVLDASTILFTNVRNITRACTHTDTIQLPQCVECSLYTEYLVHRKKNEYLIQVKSNLIQVKNILEYLLSAGILE